MIKNIKLTNFRRFKNLNLDIGKNIVVFHGNNARGKSTILEAIYLLSNGKSPWATNDEYINTEQKEDERYTRIEITDEDNTYSYYKDISRRKVKINNQTTTPQKFFQANTATIFNPEQIEILMLSSSARRKFLDETISNIDYEYTDILTMFRKVLRQRNAYLKKLAKKFYESGVIARNDPQLNFWTTEFLRHAETIQRKRIMLVKEIISDSFNLEYLPSNQDIFLEDALENAKRRDIATGYSNIGPHRDDWQIIDGKNIRKFGSRGEKRLAIGKLIFLTQDIMKKELGYYPILLLDDIASELDKENSKIIFDKGNISKQQTFITIIDYKELPKDILKDAQLVDLNELE